MKTMLEAMKNVNIIENSVTIRSVMKADDVQQLERLADELTQR